MTTWNPTDEGPGSTRPLWQQHYLPAGAVLVPPTVVRWLAQRVDMAGLRDAARTADPIVAAVLVALRAAELTPVAGEVAPPVAPGCEPSQSQMRCPQVARLAGVSGAAVRKAAAGGRLHGHRAATGHWEFRIEDVERWIEQRSAA